MFSQPEKRLYSLLKYLLVLVAVVFSTSLSLVVWWYSSAATATGDTPSSAISLVNNVNTGILASNQQRWFRISPSSSNTTTQAAQSLLLISTPDDLSQNLALQLFAENQLTEFDQVDTSVGAYGVGQWTSDLDDQPPGVLWSGLVDSSTTYYVQIANSNSMPVDYWLFIQQPNRPDSGQFQSDDGLPSNGSTVQAGRQPHLAANLPPGRNYGRLPAGTTQWYTFTRNDPSQPSHFQDLSFSLFFTPDNGNRRHRVNFQLYTAGEVEAWQRGNGSLNNFGAGMLVSRDGDPNTGERIWRGNILRDDKYYLAIENGSEVDIDFWLYDQDIINPQLGAEPNVSVAAYIQSLAFN